MLPAATRRTPLGLGQNLCQANSAAEITARRLVTKDRFQRPTMSVRSNPAWDLIRGQKGTPDPPTYSQLRPHSVTKDQGAARREETVPAVRWHWLCDGGIATRNGQADRRA
jgi:hypothetical protein